ncbi:MAG: hypothetical protein OEW18_00770 [Candidatus Aminicenantes bacterium]|nr:hypothetical protein [Candidatus Aminicenantes bacterium]
MKMKVRKVLVRVLLVLLVVVTAALVVRAVFNYTEGRKLARTLADLKGRGIPLSVADLTSPCPEENNAGRLWKAAEELLVFDKEDARVINEANQAFIRGNPFEPGQVDALSRLIEKNRQAIQLVVEAAGKPCFQYGDLKVNAVMKELPKAVEMLRASRLLVFDAVFLAERGDMEGALGRLGAGFRFASKVADEGPLIMGLVAIAEQKLFLYGLGRAAQGRSIETELLLQGLQEFEPGSWKETLSKSVRGERVFFLDGGRLLIRGGRDQQALLGKTFIDERFLLWLGRPLIKNDFIRGLLKYEEVEAQARRPYYETRKFWRRHDQEISALPWYAVLSRMAMPMMDAALLKQATLEALALTARTGLACKVYRNQTGRYPENLAVLVPGIFPEVPVDPFTGKPLIYRLEGGGFIVYSLGSNEKDDGGRMTYEITQLIMDKDDDWSWRERK